LPLLGNAVHDHVLEHPLPLFMQQRNLAAGLRPRVQPLRPVMTIITLVDLKSKSARRKPYKASKPLGL
ncbi:MAG: hypothetical protein RR311_03020, partial [Comamonas sp.]